MFIMENAVVTFLLPKNLRFPPFFRGNLIGFLEVKFMKLWGPI